MEWLSQYLFIIRRCLRTHVRTHAHTHARRHSAAHTQHAPRFPGDRLIHRLHVDERCKYKLIFRDEMNDLLLEKTF